MNKIWSIKEQQPRERLLRLGPSNLSDLELLTAVIASGNKTISAKEIAAKIITKTKGSLKKLYHSHYSVLQNIEGMGKAKYCSLTAGMELGKRMLLRTESEGIKINNATQAYNILKEYLATNSHETIVALYLDRKNQILAFEEVANKNFPSSSELNLRKLLKTILNLNASGLILAHNHPSGDCDASIQDIEMSLELKNLLSGIGIDLIDHLVISDKNFSRIEL